MDDNQINPEELYIDEEEVEAVAFENAEAGASLGTGTADAAAPVLEIAGFKFLNAADAEKARVDVNKIAYIDTHASYTSGEAMRAIYEKAIENRIFSTPVGWNFLKQIRDKLIGIGTPEDTLPSIPMPVSFTHEPMVVTSVVNRERAMAMIAENEGKKRGPAFTVSLALNIILAALVIVMFVVASVSDSDNILNYKRNVTNRYATWEQELREREQTLRQKERELGVRTSSETDEDAPDAESDEGEDTNE